MCTLKYVYINTHIINTHISRLCVYKHTYIHKDTEKHTYINKDDKRHRRVATSRRAMCIQTHIFQAYVYTNTHTYITMPRDIQTQTKTP